MSTVIDYLKLLGDLSFDQDPFNLIDNVILSNIAYFDFDPTKTSDKVLLSHALNDVFERLKKGEIVLNFFFPKDTTDLIYTLKESKRFSNLFVSDYRNIIDITKPCQFSALTFHSGDDIFVTFRGTDDTFAGWQENLNMVSTFPVIAMTLAKDYLKEMADKYKNKNIYVLGHSKGGTLAVYAALYQDDEIVDRIIQIYSNDGTGMMRKKLDKDKLLKVEPKITKIIPEESVVGMLFDNIAGKTIVVKSKDKKIFQHNAAGWEVDGKEFVTIKSISKNAKKLSKATVDLI